jgi:hypothetical protein
MVLLIAKPKRRGLPRSCCRRWSRDQRSGCLDAVPFGYDILNVASGHPIGVRGQDFLVETRHAPLMLADNLWLERPVAIASRGEGEIAQSPEFILDTRPLRRLTACLTGLEGSEGVSSAGNASVACTSASVELVESPRSRWTSVVGVDRYH